MPKALVQTVEQVTFSILASYTNEMSELPATGLSWKVEELSGFDGLRLKSEPIARELGDHDCLVKIEATSLNFRDLMIPKVSVGCCFTPIGKGNHGCQSLVCSCMFRCYGRWPRIKWVPPCEALAAHPEKSCLT